MSFTAAGGGSITGLIETAAEEVVSSSVHLSFDVFSPKLWNNSINYGLVTAVTAAGGGSVTGLWETSLSSSLSLFLSYTLEDQLFQQKFSYRTTLPVAVRKKKRPWTRCTCTQHTHPHLACLSPFLLVFFLTVIAAPSFSS